MKYLIILLLTLQSFCYQACGIDLPLPMPLAEGLTQGEGFEANNNPKAGFINLKSGNSQFAAYTEVSGTISRIWDGDTVTLDTGDRKLRIRVAGIDAPEMNQPFGRQAAHLLRFLTLDKPVKAHIFTQDKYHRYVARLYLQQTAEVTPPASAVYPAGIDVGQLMIAKGMAWHYYFFDKEDPYYYHYQKAERQAKQEGLGIWQKLSPTPPWRHRNEKTAA